MFFILHKNCFIYFSGSIKTIQRQSCSKNGGGFKGYKEWMADYGT